MQISDQSLEIPECNKDKLQHCCKTKKPNKKGNAFTDKQGIMLLGATTLRTAKYNLIK